MKQGESARASAVESGNTHQHVRKGTVVPPLKCTLKKAEICDFLQPMTCQHQVAMVNKSSRGQLKEF